MRRALFGRSSFGRSFRYRRRERRRPRKKWPEKPVRIVVPFVPGGGADVVGRILGQRLTEALGQQFIIENRGGAGSTIGNEFVAKAAPTATHS